MPLKLPYSKTVEKHILKCVRGGVSRKDMLASIAHLQNAPKSFSTLYKDYGHIIFNEQAEMIAAVGSRVYDQAINGDTKDASTFKSQELVLRAKGGWSPTHTVNEVEQEIDPDLDESATSALMSLLGYDINAPEEETSCSCENDNCRCS